MLLRKIIGISIIVLNVAGVGFILYMSGIMLKNYFFSKKQTIGIKNRSTKKNRPDIANDDIIADDEDLLKDMDLSDLDTLNLDDFE
ncbi:MAG: hypothetical protein PF690_06585 [Deltaproteobacteria bacterium]|jgi:hypothetical protein|nr:hypothetical protein [Deltaproteobacteria bacterium]